MHIPPRVAGGLQAQGTLFSRSIALPTRQFIHAEGASGRLLLVAAIIALIWANSPWADGYDRLWRHHIAVDLGFVHIDESLRHWVNDGLMAIFFFLVTLEVKREIVFGELSSLSKAAFPVAGALGGMAVPALIYIAINASGNGDVGGWGVPMATDIAFALGARAILGRGLPTAVVAFLLTLAVVDDIGAIAVIAVFYTETINIGAAVIAIALIGAVFGAQRLGINAIPAYIVIGVILWVAVLESGVHATIAGVVLGALTPAKPILNQANFAAAARPLVEVVDQRANEPHDYEAERALGELEMLVIQTESPLERLEHAIHPWSGLLVLPLFALANAGVALDGDSISDALSSAVTSGVFFGLWLGKPIGIVLFAWLAVRLGFATLPRGATWGQIAAIGALAGIGFSVSIFITDLAFPEAVAQEAKVGILAATVLAAVTAWPLFRLGRPKVEVAPTVVG
jgi:NhaA family Na+:H+ antiporter